MFNELFRDLIFVTIIISMFSYLFTKKGIKAGNRTVRLALYVVGSLFFLLFLIVIIFVIIFTIITGERFRKEDYTNAILPCVILPLGGMLFMAVLFWSIARFKKDFSDLFESEKKIESRLRANKKLNIIIWILGIAVVICAGIALETYNLFFFISFLIICLILFALSIILSR